jgi:hypothetical protein
MSGKHRKIPAISGGIGRNIAVSAGLQANCKTPFKQEAGQAATQVQKNLQAAMREALRIQDRFVAEPLFAKTGRG